LQGYLFILPATIILVVFHFLPVLYAFYISLHKWKVKKMAFLGLDNYSQALTRVLQNYVKAAN
ncbi:MAG: sugar ABC transporter permease, partial [Anaerolineae bacterium]|nr:sugar ABC transporter permease [Anaerolineae bacterium]